MRDGTLANGSGGGHAMAQLAACRQSAGIALSLQTGLFELRGCASDLAGIARALTGRQSPPGQSIRTEWGWCRLQAPCRALLLADAPHRSELDRLLEGIAVLHLDVAVSDLSDGHACLVLTGPRAERLVESAAARLAQPVMAVSDGEDYWLVVLPRAAAHDVRRVLLQEGRADGVVAVDEQVTDLHRAARRVRATQSAAITLETLIDLTKTGAAI